MSWLLVAFIPGLLMLATFGLQRLESGLVDDTLTARDVAMFLEQARPVGVGTHRPSRIEHPAAPTFTTPVILAAEQPGLPSGRPKHSQANRQFVAPRHANRV